MTTYEKNRNFLLSKRATSFPELPLDTHLCHYTDIEGLKGILESSSFWLTDKHFLNDKLEVKYSKELVVSCLNRMNFTVNITDYLHSLFIQRNDYIFSFSTEIDSIHQWNYYGGRSGYCIVYQLSNLLNTIGNSDLEMSHGQVIYDFKSQITLVEDYLKVIQEGKENKGNPEYSNFDRFEVSLRMLLGRFKQYNHCCEKEYRIIVHSRDEKVGIRNGIFTPYIQIDTSKAIPIKIIISPKLESELAIEGLNRYLKSINKSIVVESSSLQLRYNP